MGKFKKLIAMITAMAVVFSTITIVGNAFNAVKGEMGYALYWSDEFNGTSLDNSVWTFEKGTGQDGWGNWEEEYYTDRQTNAKVSDGLLKITALRENYGGKKFTSARIKTQSKKFFKYGKMEARIKVENGNQNCVWPAFWMLGQNSAQGTGWPKCGEIDIMEHANSNNYIGGCLHWNKNGIDGSYKPTSCGSGSDGYKSAFGYFSDNVNNGINGWHTYGITWTETSMSWQMDGKTFMTQEFTDNNRYAFTKDFFFILNLAIGGKGTGYTGNIAPDENNFKTATMSVDYVRVYKWTEVTTTQAPTTTIQPTTSAEKPTQVIPTKAPVTTKSIVTTKKSKSKKPAKVKIKKVKRKKKSLKVTCKKVKGVKGYNVIYAEDKYFECFDEKFVKKPTFTIKKLERKTTYYIMVRAYKIFKGKYIYGKFSKRKKVKTK